MIPNFGEGEPCVTDEPHVLLGLGARALGRHARPALVAARRADRDRGRDRLRDRVRARAPRAPVPPARAAVRLVSALLYTIPSLALFQLLVPFTGLTTTTVEIALVGYTLVILFPNIVAGLNGAPPDVLEAARGMGLTRAAAPARVELPLAVPAIVGGLRVAVVSTISIATIAAFLLPKGLGYPIFLALKQPSRSRPRSTPPARSPSGSRSPPTRRSCCCARLVPWAARDRVIADEFHPGTFVDALRFIGDHPGFLATKALEQLELAGAALGIALLVALPLGVVLGHLHRGSTVAIGASIVGRALPSQQYVVVT